MYNLKDAIEITTNIITSLGITLGSLWTYYTFFKGRTFRKKLNINIEITLLEKKEQNLLIRCKMNAMNIGSTKVDLDRAFTVIKIYLAKSAIKNSRCVKLDYKRIKTTRILENRILLEPGENFMNNYLFSITETDTSAMKAELFVFVASPKIMWVTSDILKV